MTWLFLIIPALILAGRIWAATSPSVAKGVSGGALAGSAPSPNCVSSESQDPESKIERWTPTHDPSKLLNQIAEITQQEFGAKILRNDPRYLSVVVSSRVFGFRDDLEFHLPSNSEMLQIRSASRTGYSDFGMNRKRLEKLEKILRNRQLIH